MLDIGKIGHGKMLQWLDVICLGLQFHDQGMNESCLSDTMGTIDEDGVFLSRGKIMGIPFGDDVIGKILLGFIQSDKISKAFCWGVHLIDTLTLRIINHVMIRHGFLIVVFGEMDIFLGIDDIVGHVCDFLCYLACLQHVFVCFGKILLGEKFFGIGIGFHHFYTKVIACHM